MDGIVTGSCSECSFGFSDVERLGSATIVLGRQASW
jgi:hypothetical protein